MLLDNLKDQGNSTEQGEDCRPLDLLISFV